MNKNWKIEKLEKGETFVTSEKGNSMVPKIYSGQDFKLAPITLEEVQVGDIVFARVHGRLFTHLVHAKDPQKGLQIGNNKGFINGWTKKVYGKVIEVLPKK